MNAVTVDEIRCRGRKVCTGYDHTITVTVMIPCWRTKCYLRSRCQGGWDTEYPSPQSWPICDLAEFRPMASFPHSTSGHAACSDVFLGASPVPPIQTKQLAGTRATCSGRIIREGTCSFFELKRACETSTLIPVEYSENEHTRRKSNA